MTTSENARFQDKGVVDIEKKLSLCNKTTGREDTKGKERQLREQGGLFGVFRYIDRAHYYYHHFVAVVS